MFFWIILGLGLVLTVVLTIRAHRTYDGWTSPWVHLWWFIGAVIIWCFVWFIMSVGVYMSDYNATRKVELAALANHATQEGAFFLASGYMGEELTYRYFRERNPGEFIYEDVKAYRALVIETEGDPYLELRSMCFDWIAPWQVCSRSVYAFHVPPGSILRTYELAP